jgi:hypothetical protein
MGNFLTGCKPAGFSRRTLLHRVSTGEVTYLYVEYNIHFTFSVTNYTFRFYIEFCNVDRYLNNKMRCVKSRIIHLKNVYPVFHHTIPLVFLHVHVTVLNGSMNLRYVPHRCSGWNPLIMIKYFYNKLKLNM